jgi:transcriptional regulator with XRE-family HTH domain
MRSNSSVPIHAEARGPRTTAEVVGSDLARNVVTTREVAGLTQAALAARAKLSRATLALIEAGKADPRLSTLVALAAALNVAPSDLIRSRAESKK